MYKEIKLKKQLKILITSTFAIYTFNVQANLLSNSGFESGLTDWQVPGNAGTRTVDPLAYEGVRYVYGATTATFTIWQGIDLLSMGYSSSAIDAGSLSVVFGGWQSGYTSDDTGQIIIRLLDANNNEIGVSSLASFTSSREWVEQSGTTDLLPGTRSIRYEFTGTRNFGSNNDAYLDAANLEVVPVSASTDSDGDQIPDSIEDSNDNGIVDPGETDPLDYDTDDDGLSDGYEINISGTDPTSVTILTEPGDMNGDGALNAGDLILIQKKILGN